MNDGLSTSMFWVGAMFAFTPVILTAIVLTVWWNWRRRKQTAEDSKS